MEFKERLIFEILKDKYIGSMDKLRYVLGNIQHSINVYQVYCAIVNYQIAKYGETLSGTLRECENIKLGGRNK